MNYNYLLLRVLIVGLCFLFVSKAEAQGILIKEESNVGITASKLCYFEDQKNVFLQYPTSFLQKDFEEIEGNSINYGYSTSGFLFKLELTSQTDEKLFLEISNPMLDSIFLFEKNYNQLDLLAVSGSAVSFSNRAIKYNRPNFNLPLKNGKTKTFFIYIKSNFPTKTNFQVGRAVEILEQKHSYDFWFGGYAFVMIAMLFYNLFIYFFIKNKAYLYYVLHVFTAVLLYSSLEGYLFEYFWQNTPELNKYVAGWASLARITILLFVLRFLNVELHWKRGFYFSYVLYGIFALGIASSLLNYYDMSLLFVQVGSFLLSFYVLICGIVIWRKGKQIAKYFLLAWTTYLVGLLAFILEINALAPSNSFTQNGVLVGNVLEVVLLSFALSYKINQYKSEAVILLEDLKSLKEEKDNILIKQQEVIDETLVKELSSLKVVNDEMSITNLELVSMIDKLHSQKEAIQHIYEQLKESNDELHTTLQTIEEQRDIISRKNEHITDSIRYAQTIQQSVLPLKEEIKAAFENHFLIYRPKDFVSGDFYWLNTNNEDKIYVAAIDCTGHGVPGAFMSLIGYTPLESIVNKEGIENADEVLTELHNTVQYSLKQKELNNSDGMDVALCVLTPLEEDTYEVEFAGAKRPCLYYKSESEELIEIKGTRQSIGGWSKKPRKPFQSNTFKLEKNDCLYLFSDGFPDQNNEKGEKFGSRNFNFLIKSVANKPISTQIKIIRSCLREHQGFEEQRDDIILMGIKV